MESDVVIIGAGAAGLMAARTLGAAGKMVIVLEARDRIGGRIYPLSKQEFGYEAAGGAEFIHGDAEISKKLAEEIGLTLTNPTEWWTVRDGEPMPLVERLSLHDPILEEKLQGLTEDMPLGEFLRKYFPLPQYEALWDFVRRWTEGYDAADIERASTFTFREEMLNEDSWMQMNIREGYGSIIRHLRKEAESHGAQFYFQTAATTINYEDSRVRVTTEDGTTWSARQVLVTVPLPLINTLSFTPAIPKKHAAIEEMGYGAVIKMLLRFKHKWWIGVREEIFERMFFMLSSEKVPTWWTQHPEDRPVLTGWLPGPQAFATAQLPEEQILSMALESLSNIFHISIPDLKELLTNYAIINWPADPYARGAYSYWTPWSKEAVSELRKPVSKKLYFAGEALAEEYNAGTVEAALASGKKAAQQILEDA